MKLTRILKLIMQCEDIMKAIKFEGGIFFTVEKFPIIYIFELIRVHIWLKGKQLSSQSAVALVCAGIPHCLSLGNRGNSQFLRQ